MNRNPKQTYFHHNWNSRNVFIIFWIDTKIVNPQLPASFGRIQFELDVAESTIISRPYIHWFGRYFKMLNTF